MVFVVLYPFIITLWNYSANVLKGAIKWMLVYFYPYIQRRYLTPLFTSKHDWIKYVKVVNPYIKQWIHDQGQ